jgi:hypothetical protein
VVGAIQVADDDVLAADVDAADGAVVEQEPGFQSVGGGAEGNVQHGAHQVDEEFAVADEGDAVFGSSILISVPGQ